MPSTYLLTGGRIVLKGIRVLLTALLVSSLAGCSASLSSKLVGQPAPNARLYMLDGKQVSISEFRGRNVVLAFWAAWCPKSKQMLPRLDEYAASMGGRSDVIFLTDAIDKQEDLEKVQGVIRDEHLAHLRHSFSGNEYYDEAFNAYKVDTFPTIFLIDGNGQVAGVGNDEDFLKELLH
jgi:thiol-disulfide isomerase/thioredoxin